MPISVMSVEDRVPSLGYLPLDLSNSDDRVTIEVAHRSSNRVTYGSFSLFAGFRADVVAKQHIFAYVASGRLDVSDKFDQIIAGAGEALIIPKSAEASLSCRDGARIVFSSCDDAVTASDARVMLVPLTSPGELAPEYPRELLISGEPKQYSKKLFSDSTGNWIVGLWASEPYHRKPIPYPRNELMCLHCGSVSFTRPDGTTEWHDRNSPFLITKNYVADWESRSYVFKIYCADTMPS